MVGQVKVRKYQEQWQRALAQFEDIWTWVLRHNYPVQKNQSWHTLVLRHDLWIEEINEINAAQEAELRAYQWDVASVNYDELNCKDMVIEEINHGARLHQEGKEMDHCVWSYLRECKKQGYRVFSLRSSNERATLGLYMNSVTLKCRYDQLRGPNNGMVSNHMQQLVKRLIKQINTEITKN
nr:PcfJ domain-containing protein [Aliivibrio fischeri]